jgi:hypothetical protein
MSQEMNMNEKPTLERKKTPLYQLNADKTTIPRDDQLGGEPTALGQEKWKEPTAFDSSKPITDKPVTIEITEVEYRYPKVGQEKLGEDLAKPIEQPIKPVTESAPLTQEFPEGEQKGILEGAKDKVRQGVEKTKEAFNSIKPTTTTTTTPADSEFTENKPGVIERVKGVFTGPKESEYTDQNKPGVLAGAKNMVWQGVEKAKGVFSSPTKFTEQTELHPGTGYDWKRVEEQGQFRWVATNDWSGDSANRGGILEGAKGMVRSGVEKAKGVFTSNPDAQPAQPGVLQSAKGKVMQGVEMAKSAFTSTPEQHPGRSYTWHKTTGPQGQVHWEARGDWSNDSANQMNPGIIQGAKDKVMQGVEKAKGVLYSAKPEESTTTTEEKAPGLLQGAKEKVMQGVEKAKGVLYSAKPEESTTEEQAPGLLQGAKEKVMQGVEKAKGMFSSAKPEEASLTTTPVTTTPVVSAPVVSAPVVSAPVMTTPAFTPDAALMAQEQPVGKDLGWKKMTIEKEHMPSGYGREKMTIEKSADPRFPAQTTEQTGTFS